MSGRHHPFRDPTIRAGVSEDALARLVAALERDLSSRERAVFLLRYGIQDRNPRTFDEIGEIFGVTRARARQFVIDVETKLKSAGAASGLDVEDLLPVLGQLRDRLVAALGRAGATPAPLPPLVHCPLHDAWSEHADEWGWAFPVCGYCPCVLPRAYGPGRRQRYCSNACKQAAYRARKTGAQQGSDDQEERR